MEIITQDAARQSHIEVPTYTVQVVPATEAALKKAKKKCWLHEKHVAVNKQTSADTDGTVCTPIATTAPTLGTTAAPVHLAINSTKPNMSVLDPQDSILTTTKNLVYPTTATANLW